MCLALDPSSPPSAPRARLGLGAPAHALAVLWLVGLSIATSEVAHSVDVIHEEVGDAGDPLDPQATGSASVHGDLVAIRGTLDAGDPVDTYCLLVRDPDAFVATTNANDAMFAFSNFDSVLYLFAATGYPYAANDDSPSGGLGSLLTTPSKWLGEQVGTPFGPGVDQRVLLSVSPFSLGPLDSSNQIQFDVSSKPAALHGPTGSNNFSHWQSGEVAGGDYEIRIFGAETCGPNLAFITTEVGTGNYSTWTSAGFQSGLAAADAVCQAQAGFFGLPQPDLFTAWASSTTDDAYCRIHGYSGRVSSGCGFGSPPVGAGPWVDVLGREVFPGIVRLMFGDVYRPIETLADGTPTPFGAYRTSTSADGQAISFNCGDWSLATGDAVGGSPTGTTHAWTQGNGLQCSANLPLLCMQRAVGMPVRVGPPETHRIVFTTSSNGVGDLSAWSEAQGKSGLAAGDQICRTLAADAGLPRSDHFVAWLSDSTTSAIDRITSDEPWYRLDGIRFTDSKAGLIAQVRETSANIDEDGQTVPIAQIYTGTKDDGTTRTSGHCSDWASVAADATVGLTGYADDLWTEIGFYQSCGVDRHLICLNDLPATIFTDGFESGNTTKWSAEVP